MDGIALPDGAPLQVRLFSDTDDGGLAVARIVASQPVGVGATAYILRGELGLQNDGSSCPLAIALKVFTSNKSASDQELFRRELLVSRKARHRYILPFLGTCTLGRHAVLVSQYMSNGNLQEYLQRRTETGRLRLITQVAEAVCFLHDEVGFVHGDLKCQNVLISDNGDALLADFGLSTAISKADTEATTATDIRQRNSLRFSAPELLLDIPSPSQSTVIDCHNRPRSKMPASDVYAFGMLVLQAFSGAVPWHGYDNVAVIYRIVHGLVPPRPPHAGLTDALWELCLECWSFDPSARPSMKTVLGFLQQEHLPQTRTPTLRVTMKGTRTRVRPRDAQQGTPHGVLEDNSGNLAVASRVAAPVWLSKPRVLLVDDDAVSRTISSRFLKTFGCAYDVAQDGVVALEKIECAKYDLILMDIVMPRLDGLSVTTLIRRFDPRTPIVSMTGNAAPRDVLTYFSHGMNDILSKPFTKDGLFIILAKFLTQKADSHGAFALLAPRPRHAGLLTSESRCTDCMERRADGASERQTFACIHCVLSGFSSLSLSS